MTQQNDKMVLKVLSMECKTFRIYLYILFHTLICTYEKRENGMKRDLMKHFFWNSSNNKQAIIHD